MISADILLKILADISPGRFLEIHQEVISKIPLGITPEISSENLAGIPPEILQDFSSRILLEIFLKNWYIQYTKHFSNIPPGITRKIFLENRYFCTNPSRIPPRNQKIFSRNCSRYSFAVEIYEKPQNEFLKESLEGWMTKR